MFDLETLLEEFEWFGRQKIELLYNADSNWGILPRDVELTEKLVKVKERYGYPKQFRAAYAKKGAEKLFVIAKALNDAGMSKGVTLSFQSMDEGTLKSIKRQNIGVATFEKLMRWYTKEGIPTYTELIIGLPGETYTSFKAGINTLLGAGQHDSLNIYLCAVLVGSEMDDPGYQRRHGMKMRRMPILLQHRSVGSEAVEEMNDIVVETATLPLEDWCRTYMFSWAIQTFHCLALTQYLAIVLREEWGVGYQEFYERLLTYAHAHPSTLLGQEYSRVCAVVDRALGGGKWDVVLPQFGDVIWPTEEASFLSLVCEKERVYQELRGVVDGMVADAGVLDELVAYQKAVIRDPFAGGEVLHSSGYNFHEYVRGIRTGDRVPLVAGEFRTLISAPEYFAGDLPRYAQRVVWYGRKGGSTRCTEARV